jgi:hypothetical protein
MNKRDKSDDCCADDPADKIPCPWCKCWTREWEEMRRSNGMVVCSSCDDSGYILNPFKVSNKIDSESV